MRKAVFFAVFMCSTLAYLRGFAQLPAYVPVNGLVAYYTFDGNANDESGNGNNGTNTGVVATSDRFNNPAGAYYFSGVNCDTRIDASINTSSITTELTVSYWALQSGVGCISPRTLEFAANGGPGEIQNGWSGFNHYLSNSQIVSIMLNNVPNNTWTHICYTNDGTVAKLYQDGVLINTTIATGNPILSGNVAFGRMNHPAWDAHEGKLDDIGIWNRALNECEVATLYNSGNLSYITVQPTDVYTPANGPAAFTMAAACGGIWYQWQEDPGTGFVNLSNIGVYSGVNTPVLNTSSASLSMDNYMYRCVIGYDTVQLDTTMIATLYIATTTINAHEKDYQIYLIPNPVINQLAIKAAFKVYLVEVLDALGRIVAQGKSELTPIDVPEGVYFIRVNGIYAGKILKQ